MARLLHDENDVEDLYIEWLDETYPTIRVEGCEFTPSRILDELDYTAFQQGLASFSEGLYNPYECEECSAQFGTEIEAEICEDDHEEEA